MSKPISELPQFLSDFGTGIIEILQATAENVKVRMSETAAPRSPGEKVDWDSPKQQRAWFASDGFGGGIPHQRTGAYERSWTVEKQPLGANLFAASPAAAIGGFPGGWQSRITRGRWNNLTRVLFEELGKIPDEISNLFQVLGR